MTPKLPPPSPPPQPLRLPSSVLLLLLSILIIPTSSHAYNFSASCNTTSTCGNLIKISYPFCFYEEIDVLSSSYCGYEGFKVTCGNNTPFLHSNDAKKYKITHIDYDAHIISIVDADIFSDQCLRLRHNFTLSPLSPLRYASSDANLTFFFDCADGPAEYRIPCFGHRPRNQSYVLTSEAMANSSRSPRNCDEVVVAPVLEDLLQSRNPNDLPNIYGRVLRGGFNLSWPHESSGQCNRCESSGGRCGLSQTSNSTWPFTCFCLDGIKTFPYCGAGGTAKKKKKKKILIGALAAVGFFILCATGFLLYRQKKKNKFSPSSKSLIQNASFKPSLKDPEMVSAHLHTHLFSYAELQKATNYFNTSNELGDGGFGTVYKGKLQDGRTVAVKRLFENNCRRLEQFVNEIEILSRLRHQNLVSLYGCTSPHSQGLLLVYEFVPNGTVADHLHGPRAAEGILTWPMRLSIAIETADALTYLHSVNPPIIHRDVKTCNILLDGSFHVKVADFGLSRLFPKDVTHVSTAPQGTPGYLDPEYHQCYQLTDKSDVYSFGVMLVELISSKPAIDMTRRRSEISLANFAVTRIQNGELEQLVDEGLGYRSDHATRKMITMVAEEAFRCLQSDGDMRPPIKEVLEVLKAIESEGHKVEDGGQGVEDEAELLKNSAELTLSPNTVMNNWPSSTSITPHTIGQGICHARGT